MARTDYTIQRCPHDGENPFAQISRELIRDETISPECRWLLIYLLSMKDGWELKVDQIYAHVKKFIGIKKIYKIIEEAMEAGYIQRDYNYEGNLRRGCIYYVSETPKFKKCFRRDENGNVEDRHVENCQALSNSISSNEDKREQEEGVVGGQAPQPPSPLSSKPPKRKKVAEPYKEVAPRVFLTQSQEDALKTRSEAQNFDLQEAYIKLSDWKLRKQITGGSGDFTAIVDWVITALKTDGQNSLQPKGSETKSAWLQRVREKFGNRSDMHFSSEGIVIYSGNAQKIFKLVDSGFKDHVLAYFQLMKLPIEGL